jgi:hypothetical protein
MNQQLELKQTKEWDGTMTAALVKKLLPDTEASWEYPSFVSCQLGPDCSIAFGDIDERYALSIHDGHGLGYTWGGMVGDTSTEVMEWQAAAGELLALLDDLCGIRDQLCDSLAIVRRQMQGCTLECKRKLVKEEGMLTRTISWIEAKLQQ